MVCECYSNFETNQKVNEKHTVYDRSLFGEAGTIRQLLDERLLRRILVFERFMRSEITSHKIASHLDVRALRAVGAERSSLRLSTSGAPSDGPAHFGVPH